MCASFSSDLIFDFIKSKKVVQPVILSPFGMVLGNLAVTNPSPCVTFHPGDGLVTGSGDG
jgi:hypothetical protein